MGWGLSKLNFAYSQGVTRAKELETHASASELHALDLKRQRSDQVSKRRARAIICKSLASLNNCSEKIKCFKGPRGTQRRLKEMRTSISQDFVQGSKSPPRDACGQRSENCTSFGISFE